MDFFDLYRHHREFDFDGFCREVTAADVRAVLSKERLTERDFLALLSPAAEGFLEAMAQKAHHLTVQNFGKVIFLFTPLYLSDYCENQCLYCGFSAKNPFPRKKLTEQELDKEAQEIAKTDLRHILILTGEARTETSPAYLKKALEVLKRYFSAVSLEVYPLTGEEYADLIDAGVDGLTIYQETYDERIYDALHPSGPKKDYAYRLGTPERGCRAGMRTVTVGPLLGLAEWRREVFFAGLHASYLQNTYWEVETSLSFPRFCPQGGTFRPRATVSDKHFVQILLASRLFLPRCGITVSTRESRELRNHILPLGVTKMSAWSSTAVGGRTGSAQRSEQFEIADRRSVSEMKADLLNMGYQPIFKDWHHI